MQFALSRKGLALKGAAVGLIAAGVAAAAPAAGAAASGTGTACPADRLCFWFNSDYAGARADYALSDASLNDELFTDGPVGRNGWGVQVENNAASFQNRTGHTVILFDLRNCDSDGAYRVVASGERANLGSALKNRVSSFVVGDLSLCINRDQSGA